MLPYTLVPHTLHNLSNHAFVMHMTVTSALSCRYAVDPHMTITKLQAENKHSSHVPTNTKPAIHCACSIKKLAGFGRGTRSAVPHFAEGLLALTGGTRHSDIGSTLHGNIIHGFLDRETWVFHLVVTLVSKVS